ncbi:MAG: hypothetical protein IKM95_08730 [Bacteroidales bacterium]|nr:hypothetical protein [Bacteroidales bacterium]
MVSFFKNNVKSIEKSEVLIQIVVGIAPKTEIPTSIVKNTRAEARSLRVISVKIFGFLKKPSGNGGLFLSFEGRLTGLFGGEVVVAVERVVAYA